MEEKIKSIYKNTNSINEIKKSIEILFIPSKSEKKDNDEVSTQFELIDTMLDKIPNIFWSKERRVLEPCCGKGNFVLAIFDKFYNGLTIQDKEERCRIIIKNLYFADISDSNIRITIEILKNHVFYYSSLKLEDKDFNFFIGNSLKIINSKYDAVIGNPPFNSSQGHRFTIWQEFTKIALKNWIHKDGYLLFVHPSGWRKPNTEKGRYIGLYELMTKENQMQYLEIHNKKDGWKIFDCGTRFDVYLIQCKERNENTKINDEDGNEYNIDLLKWKWLPNSKFSLIEKFLANENEEKCPIIYSRTSYGTDKQHMSEEKTEEYKYPCIHSTLKNSVRYYYSKTNKNGHFGISKVIFGESGIFQPILDVNGEYGMTHCAMAIEIKTKEEGEKIIKVLTSKEFGELIKSCCFSSFRIDWKMFLFMKRHFWLY
jgi:hypothetical protein